MIPCNSLLQAMALSLFIASCAEEPQTTSVPVSHAPGATSVNRALATELYQEINSYRQQKGNKPLQRHRGLDRLAEGHANYLIANRGTFTLYGKNVSHDGYDGRLIIARERFGLNSISENVASTTGGTRNAPQVFRNIWVGSRNHEHNLNSSWTNTGVAVASAPDGTVVAVQLFGTSGAMRSHDAMMDKFRGF